MDRTQIYLDKRETVVLDRISAETGRTRSDLIREAVSSTFLGTAEFSEKSAIQALELSAGAWSGRRTTGEVFVERLRNGKRLKVVDNR